MRIAVDFTKAVFELFANEKFLFVSFEPEKIDSTTFAKLFLKVRFQSKSGKVFNITVDPNNAVIFRNLISKLVSKYKIALLGKNWKTFFTFIHRVTKSALKIDNIMDLGWYESYESKASDNANLGQQLAYTAEWSKDLNLLKLYRRIYQPLICEVVPSMESTGLLDDNLGQIVYPNYHIEGQNNGRLSTSCEFKRCYNPHSLGEREKLNLQLIHRHESFLHFDYKNMEVSVLAELSQDTNLLNIIKNQAHRVYEEIFEAVTGQKGLADARTFGKKMFLPVIYGQTEGGLASSLEISREQAAIYISKLQILFPQAFSFVGNAQKQAESGLVVDHFGRKRILREGETIKARNFVVQSPAALICLESLVNLYNGRYNDKKEIFKIAFHVHDGYCIFADDGYLQEAKNMARTILTQPSKLLENVKLNVSVKYGKSLARMVEI